MAKSKVLVYGATGSLGQVLVQTLARDPAFSPVAFYRRAAKKSFFDGLGVPSVIGDLTAATAAEAMEAASRGCDAVVWAAGDYSSSNTRAVEVDAAKKAMEAAKTAGVKRFVFVSATGVNSPTGAASTRSFGQKLVDKAETENYLMESGLDYSIVRPGWFQSGRGGGKIMTTMPPGAREQVILTEDLAATITAALREPNAIGKAFDLHNGPTPIEQAMKDL